MDENHLGILIEGSAGGLQGFANSESIDLVGNSGENLLEAGKGEAAVTLDGGPGADNLIGGAGDNTYIVDNVGDNVTELETAGTATVESSVDYILGDYVDNLTLTGAFDINATGNSLDNVLTGNAGHNILDGGAGADVLIGGNGDDTYIVSDNSDTITESAGEGTDTVSSAASFILGVNLENLTLTGTGNINATGNGEINVLTGNAGNNILDGGAGADVLIGGNGDDTYIVSDNSDTITESAGEGIDTVISSAASFTLGANLEKLTLTGNGSINATGNELANVLTGNAGNNILDGGAGADELIGGKGDDTYIVDDSADKITEEAGVDSGTDLVISSATNFTLGANLEKLTLTGTSKTGTGNELENTITSSGGNNLAGGKGNDTYIVSDDSDTIIELATEGIDTVISSATNFALGANLEKLTLSGTDNINATGNGENNVLTGNAGNNFLDSGDGNDTLNGGAGNDSLTGGAGADTFNVDAGTDKITDLTTGDVLNVSAGATANADVTEEEGFKATAATKNLGKATLSSNGKTVNLADVTTGKGYTVTNTSATGATFTGSKFNDNLTGGGGADTLNGGKGADTLTGGIENDTYYVDNAGDKVLEDAAGGTADTVISTISYKLGNNVEHLTLTGLTGKEHINATGNSVANELKGNDGNNILDGGAGADFMIGGKGSDTYIVDDAGDTITENADSGTDLVKASVDFDLSTKVNNIENLTLTGTGNIYAKGNGQDNVLTGNTGNNILDGGAGNDSLNGGNGADTLIGGLGLDTLTGGGGADVFRFIDIADADTIRDFVTGADKIEIKKGILFGMAEYTANTDSFKTVASDADKTKYMGDANVKFIYYTGTGQLFANTDGATPGAGIENEGLIATFQNKPTIKAGDISIFV